MAATIGPRPKNGRKRPENCFRCWHCRRIDGLSSCCICLANVSKHDKVPEFIEEPYGGRCPSFYDKTIEEGKWQDMVPEENPESK